MTKIERRDGKRVFMVRANAVEQGAGAEKVAELKELIAAANIDPMVEINFEGADEDAAEAMAFFELAGLAALFLMGIILLWEFNNFYHVLLTLSAVILSTAGVLIGIQLVLPYVSTLMVGTGIVALAGIVVNNNIVLIDTFQRLKARWANQPGSRHRGSGPTDSTDPLDHADDDLRPLADGLHDEC